MSNKLCMCRGGVRRVVIQSVLLAGVTGLLFLQLGCGKGKPAQSSNNAPAAAAKGPQFRHVNSLDDLVFGWLDFLHLMPAETCTDAVFVRRVYLDTIGTLPTADEARKFLSNSDPNKRSALIDQLLARDEFADYWAMKWGDILRIKAEFPINLWPNAAQAYHHYVRTAIAENKPYDKFARELLTSSGSNFRVGQANFYRAMQNRTPEGITKCVALTFMGTRTDEWPTNKVAGMAVFFTQVGYKPSREWKEEIIFWDPMNSSRRAGYSTNQVMNVPTNSGPLVATLPDGSKVTLPANRDPREAFADWLISPTNPWFTRNIANRVWAWLVGRGDIQEPDDIRANNPPANPELLAYLEKDLIANNYDLKHLYRIILNSRTYQLSSVPRSRGPQAEAYFASYPLRRLEAEVMIDAINKITGTTELYTSAIPEPFTYIPENTPAIALGDGSITSPFLALFGRSARATGMEDERINKYLPSQALHLLNSSHIQHKLEQGAKLRVIIDSKKKDEEIVEDLYLSFLSRFPTPEEIKVIEDYGKPVETPKPASTGTAGGTNAISAAPKPVAVVASKPKKRDEWVDVAWALVNTQEFLYRH